MQQYQPDMLFAVGLPYVKWFYTNISLDQTTLDFVPVFQLIAWKAVLIYGLPNIMLREPVTETSLCTFLLQKSIPLKQEALNPGTAFIGAFYQQLLHNQFWGETTLGIHDSSEYELCMSERGIPKEANLIRPILFELNPLCTGSSKQSQICLELQCQMLLEQIFALDIESGCIIKLGKRELLVLIYLYGRESKTLEWFSQRCNCVLASINRLSGNTGICCIGEKITPLDLSGTIAQLREKNHQIVFNNSVSYIGFEQHYKEEIEISSFLQKWRIMLRELRLDELQLSVESFFEHEIAPSEIGAHWLAEFYHDFLQMFFSVLEENEIPAHKLLYANELFLENAIFSCENMLQYINSLIKSYTAYINPLATDESSVEKAKRYIRANLSSPISRTDIAMHVHLSGGHLARLFKKETGVSISDYILKERMNYALELLANFPASLGDVAAMADYDNYSYFYTLFRKMTGMKPSDYRKKFALPSGHETEVEENVQTGVDPVLFDNG